MKLSAHFLFGILFCFVSFSSQSQVIGTLFSATKDSYLNSQSVSSNYGTSSLVYAGRIPSLSRTFYTRRTVVEFNLSSIPSNAIITSAKLQLNESSSSGSPVTYAGRLKASWAEDTITWANQPSYETSDLITSSSVLSGGWLTIDVQDHVQKMVAGVCENYGWLLLNNNESLTSSTYRTLRSREDGNALLRPKLDIEYYIPIEVSSALIVHASSDEAEDGSISPTLAYGPGGLSYKWYNSEDSVLSTSLNLEDVPYGWYGLEVASSNVSDTFYHAFVVGVDCDVVDITFHPGVKYMDDAYLSDYSAFYQETNFGSHPRNETMNWTSGSWYDSWTLMKFNLWMDSIVEVSKAELYLQGGVIAPVIRSNDAHFLRATSYWDEYIVTYTSQPTYATDTIDVPETTANYEDKVVELKQYWNTWKSDNTENFGFLFALDLYNDTYARQVYYSSEDASPSNHPKIDFTLDLRKPHVVIMSWDTIAGAGEIYVDLNNVCGKIPPYKYIIAQDSIPDLGDLYAFVNDSLFGGELDSTSFFSGTSDLTKLYDGLSSGMYYIAVFDSTWNRIVDEVIHVQAEFSFSSQTGLVATKDTISATQNDAIGSLELYAHDGLDSELSIQLLDLGGNQFIGYSPIDSTVSSYEDLIFGFHTKDDTLRAIYFGDLSQNYKLIDTTTELKVTIEENVLKLLVNDTSILVKNLGSEFQFKTDIGLQNEKKARIIGNLIPFVFPKYRLKSTLQHLSCDGAFSGSIEFQVRKWHFFNEFSSGPFTIEYTVKDESEVTVTSGTSYTQTLILVDEYDNSDPLLPGTYKISGTIASTIPFEEFVTLGYEANWNRLQDFDLDPNSYSLQRSLPSSAEVSFAQAHNMLDENENGWAEIQLKGMNGVMNFITLSDMLFPEMPPGDDIAYIAANRSGGILNVHLHEAGTTNFTGASPQYSSNLRINYNSSNTTIELNGVVIGTLDNLDNSTQRYLGFLSEIQNDGYMDVITSFPCQNKDIYAKVERKLKGIRYKPYVNKLHFYMDEEYQKSTSELTYRVFSSLDSVDPVLNGSIQPETVQSSYGDNRYKLNVSSLTTGAYILEVENEKKEKFYLRFIK